MWLPLCCPRLARNLPLLALGLLGLPTAVSALPSTSVQWQNLVAGATPAASAMRDADGATALQAGTTASGDGAVLVLGYFTGATSAANFNGAWVPLTGPRSPNLPFAATSIGDNVSGASGAYGFFGLQTDFDQASSATFQNIPAAGTRLAVAIFNRTTMATSTHCNIATNDAWRWKSPSLFPDPVTINLNDSGTIWLGGNPTAFRAMVPIASFPGYPVLTSPPANLGLDSGAPLALTTTAIGAATLGLQWFKDGSPMAGETSPTFGVASVTSGNSGDYVLRATNPAGVAESRTIRVAVHASAARLLNISTRGFVGPGDSLLIPGFVALGTGSKPMLIRAVGPTIGAPPYNVPGVLANPQLSVRNAANVELAANNDWRAQSNSDAVAAAMITAGAFPIPDGSLDAALLFNAPVATNLSVHVTGVGGTTGVVITEIYVIDDVATPDARLVNISTRGFVGTGDNVMIPGFYLGAGGTRRLLIRAAGPTLGEIAPNLSAVIPNPVVRVRRTSNPAQVAFNDNWQDGGQGPAIAAAAAQVNAFALHDGWADAALILVVGPSAPDTNDRGFTIEVSDASGATGLVIAEIYELP